MAYASLSDVKDRAAGIRFGAGGFDPDKAESIIQSMSRQVEAMVRGLGYQVPVDAATSPESFAILKDIVVSGSIAQILKAMYYGIRDPEEIGANAAWREYTQKLRSLSNADDPLSLVDAVQLDIATKAVAEISGGFSGVDTYDQFRPTRDQVF